MLPERCAWLSTRTERLCTLLTFFVVATGPPLHGSIKLLSPLTSLEELNLSYNNMDGTITSDVAVFTKLKKLKLWSMGLDGKIGSIRTELQRLASNLTLSCTGIIPVELGQLVNLTRLWLHHNQLTGENSAPVLSASIFFLAGYC